MPIRMVISCVAFALAMSLPVGAHADQRLDWILTGAGDKGTYATFDFVPGALGAAIEQRVPVYGGANGLTLRAGALAAVPFGNAQADVEFRLVILMLGMSGGYRDVWRGMEFASGDDMSRMVRRERDAAGDFESIKFGFWEGRVGVVFPFNEYVLLLNSQQYRLSSQPDRVFDYQNGIVHDGDYLRSDTTLYLKHPYFGGLGITYQLLNFPLDDVRRNQHNFGFQYLGRAGLVRRDDLIVFSLMFHNGGKALGGYDNSDVYGMPMLRGPIQALLAYRVVLDL
jgi:hypothetical protein